MQTSESSPRVPRQDRSRATVEAILEAAIRVLESAGEAGFNTNAVAERAGVSIGTLYRYFPDKRAILLALARREMAAVNAAALSQLRGGDGKLARDRAMIRTFLRAFGGRTNARRVVVAALLSQVDPATLAAEHAAATETFTDVDGRPLSPTAAFVLSRGVHGAMRAAVMEGVDFLLSREFEDELVRLGRAYLGFIEPRGR